MLIFCPDCGPRDLREFTYCGDASRVMPALAAPSEAWAAYVWDRQNPRGRHAEHWQHSFGCRQFLHVVRDTATHRIEAVSVVGAYADPRQSCKDGETNV